MNDVFIMYLLQKKFLASKLRVTYVISLYFILSLKLVTCRCLI